jgi:hypothetical protein
MTVKIALENFEGTYWVGIMLGSGSGFKATNTEVVKIGSDSETESGSESNSKKKDSSDPGGKKSEK